MQQEQAEVLYTKGDQAFLKTNNSACGECSSKASCGSVKLFNAVPDTEYTIKIENNLGLKAGDTVQLELASGKLLEGTLLVYILPLLSLFVFAILGKLWGGEVVSILAGLAGLLVALLMVRKFVSQEAVSTKFLPNVIAQGDATKQ